MVRQTSDSGTVTRKPDDKVGTAGSPPAGGGRQTAQQAAITGMGSGGKDDKTRRAEMGDRADGSLPPAVGGSSGGHSDQKASRGSVEDTRVAGGLYRAERGEEP